MSYVQVKENMSFPQAGVAVREYRASYLDELTVVSECLYTYTHIHVYTDSDTDAYSEYRASYLNELTVVRACIYTYTYLCHFRRLAKR